MQLYNIELNSNLLGIFLTETCWWHNPPKQADTFSVHVFTDLWPHISLNSFPNCARPNFVANPMGQGALCVAFLVYSMLSCSVFCHEGLGMHIIQQWRLGMINHTRKTSQMATSHVKSLRFRSSV
jgi:hypothetical protein